jgi:CTP:molybdopterin cytidylyltransferase MocA
MLRNKKFNIGLLLLAAGEASRMGMPKQLLVYEKQPLIRHVIEELLVLELPLVLVLGARSVMVEPVVSDFPITIIVNDNWKAGMGSSLKAGLRCLEKAYPDMDGVLCCVVDQPFLSNNLLNNYLSAFNQRPNKREALIAARYQSMAVGVPALIGANYFQDIYQEEDSIGARKLLRQYADRVLTIDFPMGDFDLDNQQDWRNFRKI